jgi:hypothetical protein
MPNPPVPAEAGLLLGPGPAGAWDSERVSGPRVLLGPDGLWRMWYYGRDPGFDRAINLPTGRVGLATSRDGLQWQRVTGPLTLGAVFEAPADPSRFDAGHVGVSDVHWRDGLYWMWYFGGSQAIQQIGPYSVKGIDLRPGLAISRDGLRWQRVEGPHRGALLELGAPGAFDMVFCGWPQVVADARGWKLYYHTIDTHRLFRIGVAVSDDGLHWRKHGEVLGPGAAGAFDEQGVATRTVIHHGGRYQMFYEGVGAGGYRSIGLAVSDDGLTWQRQPGPEPDGSVFAHAPRGSGRWDAYAIGAPSVVALPDGRLRMYYIGSNEAGEGEAVDELRLRHQIGLAVCDGHDLTRWRRHGQ